MAGVLIFRIDVSLLFANAHTVKQRILDQIEQSQGPVHLLILDLESSPMIDLSGAAMIEELCNAVESRDVQIRVAGAKGSVRQLLRSTMPGRFSGVDLSVDVGQIVHQQMSLV